MVNTKTPASGSTQLVEALEPRRLLAAGFSYTSSWLGNSDGNRATHILQDIANLYVSSDGKAYASTRWDEGGSNAEVFNPDGTLGTVPSDSGTGGWGRMSNAVTTGDGTYLYLSMSQDSSASSGGTNSFGGPRYPAAGSAWQVIRRYNLSTGNPVGVTGGAGWDGSMLITAAEPVGLAVRNNEIYSAESDGVVRVYNATTMSRTPVRQWPITNPGTLAFDSAGYLWMLQPTSKALVRYSTAGNLQPQRISLTSCTPTGFGIDPANNRIYVTNNNVDQNVLIYASITTAPVFSGTFGTTGGIFAGSGAVIGTVGPLRFNHPTGVGVDNSGNIYVSCDGASVTGGTVLEKYNAAGVRQWVKYGLTFVDSADISPASETDIYTGEEHYVMDYSQPAGQQWTYKGFTLNPFKYPQDPRNNAYPATSPWVRDLSGQRFLFASTGMMAGPVTIYRFNTATDGQIAIPCGMISGGRIAGTWPANQPASGGWIWRDLNGNGAFDPGEFAQPAGRGDLSTGWAWSVDIQGNIWTGSEGGAIREYAFGGLDANGSPKYDFAHVIASSAPSLVTKLNRLEYVPTNDTMYLGAFTTTTPQPADGNWGVVGTEILKINNWSTGNRTPAVRISLPYNSNSVYMKCMSITGDYAFVAECKGSNVHVYNLNSGSEVGTFNGSGTFGNLGWVDIPYGVRAYRRTNGQYVVLVEEDYNAKILMYQWTPTVAAPTALAATAKSSTRVDLAWIGQSSGETGFKVERATDSGFTKNLVSDTAPAGAASYAATGLSLNNTYYFRVAAMGSGGNSPFATAVHGTLRMGDANLDGQVDLTDLTTLAGNWQGTGKSFADGDFSGDGLVDLTDLTILAGLWQTPIPAPLMAAATAVSVDSESAIASASSSSLAVATADPVDSESATTAASSPSPAAAEVSVPAPDPGSPMLVAPPAAAATVLIARAQENPLRASVARVHPPRRLPVTAGPQSTGVFSNRPLAVASPLMPWPTTSRGASMLLRNDRQILDACHRSVLGTAQAAITP